MADGDVLSHGFKFWNIVATDTDGFVTNNVFKAGFNALKNCLSVKTMGVTDQKERSKILINQAFQRLTPFQLHRWGKLHLWVNYRNNGQGFSHSFARHSASR